MKKLLTTLIISASLFLGACGQTGPLFLPDQPDKIVDGR
ncbi:MAG: lipoprotein [Pseudomonadota bacterium]|nr:lipoprotein [Pseudomonadota bacterium]MEE2820631.1 lipoprotein [Pseudomonadota bacterium]